MDLAKVSKAIAGALATGVGAVGTASIVIPTGITMPWWGYVIVGLANAVLGFVIVYGAPANKPA